MKLSEQHCHGIWLVGLAVFAVSTITLAGSTGKLRLAEKSLRARAVESPMPRFPQASREAGSVGVAVSEVLVDEKGNVTSVKVLESPDAHIETAVTEALNKWRFRPTTIQGRAVPVEGKLTFYFRIDDAGARVENPKDS